MCLLLMAAASAVGGTGIWWLQVPPDGALWLELRLPRVVNGALVGGLLALAGMLLQVVLRNPLADPFLFGSASGAALAQVLALGLAGAGFVLMNLAGFVGALVASLLVVALAKQRQLAASTTRLIVLGVAVSSLLGAALQVSLLWLSDRAVRGLYFWLMGSVSEAWQSPWFYGLFCLVLLASFSLRLTIDALAHGPVMARNWGVDADQALRWLLLLSSLATALAVGSAGALGFVGLAGPHLARLLVGSAARYALPASVLVGATLVVVADGIARWLLSPVVLPVGILTTLLGVPWLIHLLRAKPRYD